MSPNRKINLVNGLVTLTVIFPVSLRPPAPKQGDKLKFLHLQYQQDLL
jgi:hypothetical protein